jgi:DNA-binding response OmpR family regulator
VRVLLVEDSERLRRSVGAALRKSGFALDVAHDGPNGLALAESNDYDVIVLDVMLPGLDGLSVLRTLRSSGTTTHVLLLTAKDTIEDRVCGLQTGADDYLVKPFALEELLARVQPREYLLLEYLARRSGELVTRADIAAHIYDQDVDPLSNVIDSAISSLRKKISVGSTAPLIHTRHGLGYVLKVASE